MEDNKPRQAVYDPLDMHQYRIEKLPKREKSKVEKWLAILGPLLALIAFIVFGFFTHLPFLTDIDPAGLISEEAKKAFEKLGPIAFSRSNHLMLAIFAASILLWLTDAIPNYLTSLLVIISLILCNVLPEKAALAQLGHPVMWLNIMSFVLASMLVKTGIAKRFALWFLLRFGK
ncbi:MAG: anion permease, partial [Bacteroidales bacterium]|nr:anion permease [Bacteroidales bacterium]